MPAVFWPHTNVLVSAVLRGIAGNCCLPSFGGGRGHAPGTPDTLDGPSTSRFPLAPDHVPDLAASATQPMETAPNAGMRTYVHDLPFANLDQRRSAWAGSRKPRERRADHLESDHRSFADVMQYSANAEACRIAPLLAMIAYRSYTGSATHPSKATAQHPSATPSAPWISPEVSGLAASCQRVFAD